MRFQNCCVALIAAALLVAGAAMVTVPAAAASAPSASVVVTGMDGAGDTSVHLSAAASQPSDGATITNYRWSDDLGSEGYCDSDPTDPSYTPDPDKVCTQPPAAVLTFPAPQSPGGENSWRVTLTVTDSSGQSASASIIVTPGYPVQLERPAPVSTYQTQATAPVNVLSNGLATDVNGSSAEPLIVTLRGQPAYGTATVASDGDITYQPSHQITGPDVVNYMVTDAQGYATYSWFIVNVLRYQAPRFVSAGSAVGPRPHVKDGRIQVTVHDPNGATAHQQYLARLTPLFAGSRVQSQHLAITGGLTMRLLFTGLARGEYQVRLSDGTGNNVTRKVYEPYRFYQRFSVSIAGHVSRHHHEVLTFNNRASSVPTYLVIRIAGERYVRRIDAGGVGTSEYYFPKGKHWVQVYFKGKLVKQRLVHRKH